MSHESRFRNEVARQILIEHMRAQMSREGKYAEYESVINDCWSIPAFKRFCRKQGWEVFRDTVAGQIFLTRANTQ